MHVYGVSLLFLLSLSSHLVHAETVTTAQIVQRTLTGPPTCLNWRWIGNCFWKDCDLLGCEVTTSIKARHYLPDLLVTVQRTSSEIPWLELRRLLASAQSAAIASTLRPVSSYPFVRAGGDVAVSTDSQRHADVRFFEANVFGHPLEKIPFEADKLLCEAVTQPGKPYYQSSLDAIAWRFAPIESLMPDALIPGRREIGKSALESWGSVYPRTGFIVQQDPVRAAAVIAQRACDIAIGPRNGHIALELESPATYTTVPNHLNESDAATGLWQMISPKVDVACELFGSGRADWSMGRIDETRAFIWNLWRPYECCEPNGETYLGSIHF